MKILMLVGSLRADSWTAQLTDSVANLLPTGDTTQAYADLGALPHYDQDLDTEHPPASVVVFRSAVAEADALVVATPEYNGSIPGVLKNAIDVGSRPYGKSSFLGKPIGIVSNSPGPLGGVNAAKHLQNILPGISGPIMGQPEIYLNSVGDAFDDKGECTKEALQKVLQQYIDAFATYVERHHR